MEPPDPRPGWYYVSAVEGSHSYLLAGPWPTHAEALAQVEPVRRFAEAVDPRAVWMAYGTARRSVDDFPRQSSLGADPQNWSVI